MQWFKKIFGNKENEIEEDVFVEEEQLQSEQREMKTRMTYEYPKAPFRFPLIEDPVRKPARKTATPVEKKEKEKEQVKPRQPLMRKPPEQKTISREPKRPVVNKIEPRNKRPFQPTEIPSPIFGFRRPVPKEETTEFEYELQDSFLAESAFTESEPKVILEEMAHSVGNDGAEVHRDMAEEKEIQHSFGEETGQLPDERNAEVEGVRIEKQEEAAGNMSETPAIIAQRFERVLEETESIYPETDENPNKEPAHQFLEKTDKEDMPVGEAAKERDLVEEEPIVGLTLEAEGMPVEDEKTRAEEQSAVEKLNQEDSLVSEAVEDQHFAKDEKPIDGLALAAEGMLVEDEITSEEEQSAAEKLVQKDLLENEAVEDQILQKNQEAAVEPIHATDEAACEVSLENKKTVKEEEFLAEAEAVQEEMLDSVVELSEVPSAESEDEELERPRSRGQMPFNVLMLKEDRKRWEYRKQAQLREQQRSLHVIGEEQAASVEEAEPSAEQAYQAEAAVPAAEKAEALTAEEVEIAPDAAEVSYEYYESPSTDLLSRPVGASEDTEWLEEQSSLLDETLINFNVHARVVHVSQGPSVTRFEIQPDPGVKVSKITNLIDDIKLSMAAKDIRIEAPIPGKRSVGIEIPNQSSRPVQLSEIIESELFDDSESPLTAALGLDISGTPVVTDIRKMPHGLIAGATGSGKSVCINSILISLLYKASPEDLKLMLIDPKMVELAPYNHIPHLVSPVITDVKAATAALKWAVEEMERRYELFAHASVRDISRFNQLAENSGQHSDRLPYLVIVIDELADLMMMAPADVEESICRIAQKARACGIHLLIATQRPSVDVITGLIKANVPTRIAFSVSSQVDSRTIIDISGAERLLGRGDMLFLDSGSSKPVRLQGTFVSDEEIDRVIEHVRSQGAPDYLFEQDELLKKAQIQEDEDELFMEACEFVIAQGSASTSLLQRQYRIGYNRAARLMSMMEERGIISGSKGSKARDVLAGEADLELLKETLAN